MVYIKKTEKVTEKEALEKYASYHDRLLDWRNLSSAEQTKILRPIYSHTKNVNCLTPGCTTRLSTYNGMQYHLKFCGISALDRPKQCSICLGQIKSGEMRDHMKRHANESKVLLDEEMARNGGKNDSNVSQNIENGENTGRKKRKANLKAKELFAQLAANSNDDSFEVKPSPKKLKKIDVGLEVSEEEYSDNESNFDNDDEQPSSKKANDSKKHKKFTFLPESFRKEWKKQVATAYERIISDDHMKNCFEEWIIEKNSWISLSKSDIEPHVSSYKDKSCPFRWTDNSIEKFSLNLLEATLTPNEGGIGFCGAPIVATAWCPIPVDHSIQYIAVSTHPNANLNQCQGESPACIQIWSCAFESEKCQSLALELLLAHNYGVVMDIRWCPSGIWQSMDQTSNAFVSSLPRLGALAVTSSTGEIVIFGIPHPASLKKDHLETKTVPIFKSRPLLVLYCDSELISYSLDWSHFNGHERLAAGFHDGTISIWNLKKPCELLLDDVKRLLPHTSISVSKAPVRCLRWYSATKILLCSMNRTISLWDVDQAICIWSQNPQHLILAVACSPVLPGFVTSNGSSMHLANFPSYVDTPSQTSIMLNRYHQSTVWAFDTSSWNGCTLSVDNQGFVGLSCIKAVPSQDSLKRKFVESVLLRTICTHDELDKKFVPMTSEEAKKCSLQFVCENAEMKKNELEKEFKRLELTGHYPLAALFAVSWNPNKNYSHWCCFGGQTGLLFVHDTKM